MSGNGVDLGAIYQATMALSTRLDAFEATVATGFQRVHGELTDLRAAVNDYHGAVIGHGILLTELEERVTRLEEQRQR